MMPRCFKCGSQMVGGAPHGPRAVQYECHSCGVIQRDDGEYITIAAFDKFVVLEKPCANGPAADPFSAGGSRDNILRADSLSFVQQIVRRMASIASSNETAVMGRVIRAMERPNEFAFTLNRIGHFRMKGRNLNMRFDESIAPAMFAYLHELCWQLRNDKDFEAFRMKKAGGK